MTVVHQGLAQKTCRPEAAPPRAGRRLLLITTCLLTALALGFLSPHVASPIIAGDSADYFLMLESWFNHGTPDLRPADIHSLDQLMPGPVRFSNRTNPYKGYRETEEGRWYCIHFWVYPLLALPAKAVLRHCGGNEIAAFQVTNVILFCLTAGLVLFHGCAPTTRRLVFLALAALGPILWFLRWPHPESFTWCCAVASLFLLSSGRYGWSTTAAAIGSMQNPPLALLALGATAVSIARHRKSGTVAAAGMLPGLIVPLFYLHHFGVPNLIAHTGGVDFALISYSRTISFLADLDQGMLPHLPAVLLLGLAGAALAVIGKRHLGITVFAVLLGIILLVQAAPNWNNGTSGPMRYTIWIVPFLAWLAACHLPLHRRWLHVLLVAGLLLQAGLVVSHDGRPDYLVRSPVASAALDRFPSLIHPEPEIFTERQTGQDGYFQKQLPVAFVGHDGSMVKILTDEERLTEICQRFALAPRTGSLRIHRVGYPFREFLYLHPPRGAIKVVEPLGWGGQALRQGINCRLDSLPGAILDPELHFHLRLTNTARYRFWGSGSGARHPLFFACRIIENGIQIRSQAILAPFDLAPGETVRLPVRTEFPRRPGNFTVEIQASLKNLVWDERTFGFSIEVLGVDKRSYMAKVDREGG